MNDEKPRQYTAEEIRDQFINHMWDLVEYWDKHVKDQNMPIDRRLQGLMHSVLTTLDGCSMDLPGFALVTTPHESDKDYHKDQGENWYPENDLEKMNEPVCFMLHEDFYSERLRRDK